MRTIVLALAFASAACARTSPLDYRAPGDAAAEEGPDASLAEADAAGFPVDAGASCVGCVPECHGALCGPDGCGGSCGACTDSRMCMVYGDQASCNIVDIPDCTGRECGGDGLGGLCGVCPASWRCGVDDLCKPAGGGCGSVGASGICIGGFVVTCHGGSLVHTQCQFDACETDGSGNAACTPLPCIPDCFGMACGDDGCGGSCGTCAAGAVCLVPPNSRLGRCIPAGPPPGQTSVCTGGSLIEWRSGTSATVSDCLAKGLVCDDSCQPAACRAPGDARPCGALPAAGHCAGDYAFECVGGKITIHHCRDWGYGGCRRVGLEKFDCWP